MLNRIQGARTWALIALAAAAVAPIAVACGGDKPPENPPPSGTMGMQQPPPGGYPPGYPGAPPGYPGQPTGQPTQPGYPPPQPTGPATAPPAASTGGDLGTLLAGIASAIPGIFVPPGANPRDNGEAGLKQQAALRAPGMSAEGNMLKQTLTEGQHVEMMVPMQAGKCYTVVGFAPTGGVRDLDLNLMHPLSLPPYTQIFESDKSANNTPVLFAAPNQTCPVSPIPLQYKLDIHAKAGAGIVLVQVYSKPK